MRDRQPTRPSSLLAALPLLAGLGLLAVPGALNADPRAAGPGGTAPHVLGSVAPAGPQDEAREAAYDALQGLERQTPVTRVAQVVMPSVVYIETEATQRVRDFLFGDRDVVAQGGGTGVVVHEDGYLITNFHVVRGASTIHVSFAGDPLRYDAELLSYKEAEDLALLRILDSGEIASDTALSGLRSEALSRGEVRRGPAGDLRRTVQVERRRFPAVRMGTSGDLMQGERVVAIGNPHGHEHTVSTGIVSGLHRDIEVGALRFRNLIQTDASINLGNSGGPLLNIRGELIGINTVMNTAAENIGFAIPVDRVREVLEEELYPNASRSWFGLELDPGDTGRVLAVVPGGPAAAAGICEGDRLLSLGAQPLVSPEDWVHASLQVEPRVPVELRVERDGATRAARLSAWDKLDGILFQQMGVTVREARFQGDTFLIVESVAAGSPAEELGLEAGDLIPAVLPRVRNVRSPLRVRDRKDLAAVLERLEPGTRVALDVYRDEDRNGEYTRSERYTGEFVLR